MTRSIYANFLMVGILAGSGMVRAADPDTPIYLDPSKLIEWGSVVVGAPPAPVFPNDAEFSNLWALHNVGQTVFDWNGAPYSGLTSDVDINAPEAWAFGTGSMDTLVAIVDTGVDYTHPDLYLNIWINEAEIPPATRAQLTDVDGDGHITFYDLNHSINQGQGKITDNNANGYIDAGDLLRLRWCTETIPEEKFDPDQPLPDDAVDCTTLGWEDWEDNDGNGYTDDIIGWDFYDHDNDPLDENYHGTHVAGTIGASGDNGAGVTGVNWASRLMPLRLIGPTGSLLVDWREARGPTVDAIRYAVNMGARISNHSWGWDYQDIPRLAELLGYDASGLESLETLADLLGFTDGILDVAEAIRYARDRGHLLIAGAGNGGADGVGDNIDHDDFHTYPASFDAANLVAVANVTYLDDLRGSSNFGRGSVDLGAPGHRVLSTLPTYLTDAMVEDGLSTHYGMLGGTSMATPHVAGVAALLWNSNPSWSYRQVVDTMLATVTPMSTLSGRTATGGRLNAAAAVAPGPFVLRNRVLRNEADPGNPVNDAYAVTITLNEAVQAGTLTLQDTELLGPDGETLPVNSVDSSDDGRSFTLRFDTIIDVVGHDYTLILGPEIDDLEGNGMDQNRDGVSGQDTDAYQVRFHVKSTVPDDLGVPDRSPDYRCPRGPC